MHFPISGVEVSWWLPPAVALAISFFTSMGGVSGAFLLLPFQVSILGYTAPSVSATNQVFNIVAIPSGVYRYVREQRMVWPLVWAVAAGTLPGVVAGAWVRIVWLPDPSHFKGFAGCVLLYVGVRLAVEVLRRKPRAARPSPAGGAQEGTRISQVCVSGRAISYAFRGKTYSCSPWAVLVLCLVVGVVGGIYGIGGGAIIAPFFVAVMGLPVHTVAGAALMGTFLTSIAGTLCYQLFAGIYTHLDVAPDWPLGLLFGAGGFLGMYLGARCQKFVPDRAIKALLAAFVLFTAAGYLADFFNRVLFA